jgi:DNA-binding protein
MVRDPNTIVVGRKHRDDYVLSTIVLLNQGAEYAIIRGQGDLIYKAVDVYNSLKERLGDSLRLEDVSIGSEKTGSRRISYIEIKVRRAV